MKPAPGHLALLKEQLQAAGISAALCEKLALYGALLLDANRRVNLTGAKTPESLLEHILDSLSVKPYVHENLLDVGSGGGLPAIPLALALGVPIAMVEATGKKATFLRAACGLLSVTASVHADRAERLAFTDGMREAYQTGTARAVALAPTVLELCMPFIALGGRMILQRGTLDAHERAATADAALMLGGTLVEEVPLGGERRLLIVEKSRITPLRFPRRAGVPVKRPLCM